MFVSSYRLARDSDPVFPAVHGCLAESGNSFLERTLRLSPIPKGLWRHQHPQSIEAKYFMPRVRQKKNPRTLATRSLHRQPLAHLSRYQGLCPVHRGLIAMSGSSRRVARFETWGIAIKPTLGPASALRTTLLTISAHCIDSSSVHKLRRYDVGSEVDYVSIRLPLPGLQRGIHPAPPHF